MKPFIVAFVVLCLSACFPKAENDLGQSDNNPDDTDTVGGAASLVLKTADLLNSDYPLAVHATVIASAGAQYEISLNGQLVEAGNMPAEPKPQGPFSGLNDGNNERWVYFVISEPGQHSIELTETLNGEVETDSVSLTLGSDCDENDDFFNDEPAIQSADFSCTGSGCHNGTAFPIDLTNFDTLAETDIFGRDAYMNFAHMPAQADVTPYATGGKLIHTGDVKWTQNSATHMRMMEVAFRAYSSFTCP
ncbi:hypothetical protein QWZ13_04845 [Reinekea marina]|uniref:Uncharacterized protein n=1 Tax=Reinekea marina TaxID=1310421 RepID=A0ABV7WTA6_9GAMM|nr:hypothetical protein [Reinekea marina]MDN3648234.1 hypothetical protein [Reinekea marina]